MRMSGKERKLLEDLQKRIRTAIEKGYNGEEMTKEEEYLFNCFISCDLSIEDLARSLMRKKGNRPRWRW